MKQELTNNKNSTIAILPRFKTLLPCRTECRLDDFQLFNISTINQIFTLIASIPNPSKCYDTLFNETIRLANILQLNAIGIYTNYIIFWLSFCIKINLRFRMFESIKQFQPCNSKWGFSVDRRS